MVPKRRAPRCVPKRRVLGCVFGRPLLHPRLMCRRNDALVATRRPPGSWPVEQRLPQPYVLAFVGQNAHGILEWWTREVLRRLGRYGLAGHLVDVLAPDWQSVVGDALASGSPRFCFSFQGIGMSLAIDGENLWDKLGVPFVASMGDAPYHAPALHTSCSRRQVFLYTCQDFLDTYRTYFSGRVLASVGPFGVPENPLASATPWARREHGIVFVKTGIDPSSFPLGWAGAPAKLRAILHDSAAAVLSGEDKPVADLCARYFDDHGIHWAGRREVFLRVCSEVDFYVRAVRAERMVRHLMRHDALIFGDWRHLDTEGARARFCGPVPASELHALYAQTRVLANTSPTVRHGTHDRIMSGLVSNCAVLSDTTPFLQSEFRDCPGFLGVDIDASDCADQIDAALAASATQAQALDNGHAEAVERFGLDAFVDRIDQALQLEFFAEQATNWRAAA